MTQIPTSLEQLIEKVSSYLPEERIQIISDAYEFAHNMHAGQKRRSGEPYIHHPVTTALYLADLHLDPSTIAAALLHDVIEDCGVPLKELERVFGPDISRLVDGVTKLTKLDLIANEELNSYKLRADSSQAESLRKMLLAMAEDIRVVLIKLADRLHNMRTLEVMPPEKRVAIAQETLEIYAPLAHRLGMGEIKWQLEDFAFHYLQPNQYRSISKLLSSKRRERELYIDQVTDILRRELGKTDITAEVTGRPKHIYSIYRKSETYTLQGKQLSDIFDLFAVRVLVNNLQDCYGVLGVIHSLWRPIPGQFDDYIAIPKENLYQSLHTTVRCINNMPVEIQVRTHQMHNVAEFGVAAHWHYKQGSGSPTKDMDFDEKMTWLRQLLEWQREVTGAEEFLESVKTDIFRDQVFVYTPKGDIKELPMGSTPLDLAYRIHTELGHRYIGAKVNGKLMSMDYQLRNGDTVEIMTSKVARGPSLDWLNSHLGYVKTANAKQAIRSWFRKQERGSNVKRGQEIHKKELRRLNVSMDGTELAKLFRLDSDEDLWSALGSGVISTAQIAARLSILQESTTQLNETKEISLIGSSQGIEVLGVGDLLTHMAQCCHPLPGEQIIGYVTRSRGVTIHRNSCPNVKAFSDHERIVTVAWGHTRNLYPIRLSIEALDRVGLLRDITAGVSSEGINMLSVITEVHEDSMVSIFLTIQVTGMEQVSRLFSRVENIKGVSNIHRITSSKNTISSEGQNISKLR